MCVYVSDPPFLSGLAFAYLARWAASCPNPSLVHNLLSILYIAYITKSFNSPLFYCVYFPSPFLLRAPILSSGTLGSTVP